MGIAAYNRGSAVNARLIRQEAGTWQEPIAPKPRPATWGTATAERALARARSILASNRRVGRVLDAETLAGAVQLRERVSDAGAMAAAQQAIAESVAKPNGPLSAADRTLLDRLVRRAQGRITADVREGVVSARVAEYADLHEYVDANVYLLNDRGEFDRAVEAKMIELPGDAGFDSQPMYDFLGLAQERIEAWIKAGGLRDVRRRPGAPVPDSPELLKRRHRAAAPVDASVRIDAAHAEGSFTFGGATHRGDAYEYVDVFGPDGAPLGGGQAIVAPPLLWCDGTVYRLRYFETDGARATVLGPAKANGRERGAAGPPATKAAHAPNTVYGMLRDRNGAPLAVLSRPYEGVKPHVRMAAAELQAEADARGYAWSGVHSQWIATGPDGRALWAISPNLAHVNPVGSDAAAYTLGDLSRDPTRNTHEAPMSAARTKAPARGRATPKTAIVPRSGGVEHSPQVTAAFRAKGFELYNTGGDVMAYRLAHPTVGEVLVSADGELPMKLSEPVHAWFFGLQHSEPLLELKFPSVTAFLAAAILGSVVR